MAKLVKDLMNHRPVTIDGKVSLLDAINTMSKNNIGSLIIVDEEGRCKGIITERDVIHLIAKGVDLNESVETHMTKNPITIRPENTMYEAVNIMQAHKIRHLPVVDKKGALLGILSQRDLLVIGEVDKD